MKILTAGGGSGGHVTPVVAVLHELRERHPHADIRFWCDRHFAPEARQILANYDPSLRVQTIVSGKFRRYHHLTKLQHLTIPSVVFPNIRDAFYVFFGVVQSFWRLLFWRPNVVFLKGGFVCLPIGWAAWLLGIPIVIHDSDAHPGLTNRLLAPLAKRIATGVPLEHYNYPPEKSQYVGIPISSAYEKITDQKRAELKQTLGFSADRPLVVFVGGGQGSRQINDAVALHLDELLKVTNVYLVSGTAQYDELRSLTPEADPRFVLKNFISHGMEDILGAADVVVSRAGATFLLELAALAQPTIVIPSKRLTWQVKHAKLYADEQAVLILDEDKFEDPNDTSMVKIITALIANKPLQHKLMTNLHRMARPRAAGDMAEIVLRAAGKRR